MTDEKVYLTKQGKVQLEEEVEMLKNEKRPEVIQRLQEARAQGDLSENADYDAAREEQAQLEARIKQIESMLSNVEIIEEQKADVKTVSIGTTVEIRDISMDMVDVYRIVGSTEANPLEGKISNESPIALAILNKQVGEKALVDSPGGEYEVEILNIK